MTPKELDEINILMLRKATLEHELQKTYEFGNVYIGDDGSTSIGGRITTAKITQVTVQEIEDLLQQQLTAVNDRLTSLGMVFDTAKIQVEEDDHDA